MSFPVISPIVSQHAEEAAFLWLLRSNAIHAPHYSLKDQAKLDGRVEAHLDGLRVAWTIPPQPISIKEKSDSSGVAVKESGKMFVSDYDLMSVWRRNGAGWRTVFASAANGASRGRYSFEATAIIIKLSQSLVSRIQHGCQDAYCSPHNPGVKMADHFWAFCNGVGEYSANPAACKSFYERNRLVWLYGPTGAYLFDVARQELAQ